MSRAGVSNEVAERVLGHAIPGVAGVYNRHDYLDEKRDDLERLDALICRTLDPSNNVVPLRVLAAAKSEYSKIVSKIDHKANYVK
jgi:hypothetical protein